jgi:wyosine [tRNA(Phe)-imidazoG37] synthetase (radical SAM superfamily)
MKPVYGPVPSRRLGRSLGVDPIPPKTCNWNCVYCQLGRTQPVTNDRRDHFSPDAILAQVKLALRAHPSGGIDWITFVGSGEPTLHAHLGTMIREVKALCNIPVAVITNGSLLFRREVREELSAADAVLASLDAGSNALYRTVNRPHPDIPYDRFRDGLVTFSQEYSGRFWLETMLIDGLNDDEMALQELAAVVHRIDPDELHINIPIRPPAEAWVAAPGDEALMRATAILGESTRVLHSVAGEFDLSGRDSAVDAVIAVISRHPMREDELLRLLSRWAPGRVMTELGRLVETGRAQVVTRFGHRFWTTSDGAYAEQPGSRPFPPPSAGDREVLPRSGPQEEEAVRET